MLAPWFASPNAGPHTKCDWGRHGVTRGQPAHAISRTGLTIELELQPAAKAESHTTESHFAHGLTTKETQR